MYNKEKFLVKIPNEKQSFYKTLSVDNDIRKLIKLINVMQKMSRSSSKLKGI